LARILRRNLGSGKASHQLAAPSTVTQLLVTTTAAWLQKMKRTVKKESSPRKESCQMTNLQKRCQRR
jgi:hypothetical protein